MSTKAVVIPVGTATPTLKKPSNTVASPVFATMYAKAGTMPGAYASKLPGKTWNCGFTDMSTKKNIFYKNNVTTKQIVAFNNTKARNIGIRGSTNSTTGKAIIYYGLVA